MKQFLLSTAAAVIAAALCAPAYAGGNNFSSIGGNIIASISAIPGLISGVSYLAALLLGALGIIKIKDHVENPQQTPLKDGAARLLAGGALFALPVVFESMHNTIGSGGPVSAAMLQAVAFGGGGGGAGGGCSGIFC